MKNVHKMILVAASTSVLFVCGSSGSGSGVTGTISGGGSDSGSVPTSVNSTFQGAKIFDGTAATGNSFAGTLSDDGSGGTYSGSFFGPAAEELGGIGKSNPYIDANGDGAFSFGAKKQ